MKIISDAERARIQEEARAILAKFSATLSGIKVPLKSEHVSGAGYRAEGEGKNGDATFREIMFANAPHQDRDSIIVEKKTWS